MLEELSVSQKLGMNAKTEVRIKLIEEQRHSLK